MLQPYFNCALLVLAESLWSREGFEPGNRLPRKKSFSILIQFLVHFSLFLAFLTNDRVIFSCSLQTSPLVTVMIPKFSDRKVKVWTRSHANGFLQQLFLFQKCMFKEWIHSTTHPYLKMKRDLKIFILKKSDRHTQDSQSSTEMNLSVFQKTARVLPILISQIAVLYCGIWLHILPLLAS